MSSECARVFSIGYGSCPLWLGLCRTASAVDCSFVRFLLSTRPFIGPMHAFEHPADSHVPSAHLPLLWTPIQKHCSWEWLDSMPLFLLYQPSPFFLRWWSTCSPHQVFQIWPRSGREPFQYCLEQNLPNPQFMACWDAILFFWELSDWVCSSWLSFCWQRWMADSYEVRLSWDWKSGWPTPWANSLKNHGWCSSSVEIGAHCPPFGTPPAIPIRWETFVIV